MGLIINKYLCYLLLIFLSVVSFQTVADNPAQTSAAIDIQEINKRIELVNSNSELSEKDKILLSQVYRDIIQHQNDTELFNNETRLLSATAETLPVEIKSIQNQLAKGTQQFEPFTVENFKSEELKSLEQTLRNEKASLTSSEAKLIDLTNQYIVLRARPSMVRDRLSSVMLQQQILTNNQISFGNEKSLSFELRQAKQWALEAHAIALTVEITRLDTELVLHEKLLHKIEVEAELAELLVDAQQSFVNNLEKYVSLRRHDKITELSNLALQSTAQLKGTKLEQLALHDVLLRDKISNISTEIDKISKQDDLVRIRAKQVSSNLTNLAQKLELTDGEFALGTVLIEQRANLPRIGLLKQDNSQTQSLIAKSALNQIELEEERQQLRDLPDYLNFQFSIKLNQLNVQEQAQAYAWATERIKLLVFNYDAQNTYQSYLAELDLAQRQLINIVQSFDQFLSKRVLWVQSSKPVSPQFFSNLRMGTSYLSKDHSLAKLAIELTSIYTRNPIVIIGFALSIGLMLARKYLHNKADAYANFLGRVKLDKINYTLIALTYDALIAVTVPLFLITMSWGISITDNVSLLAKSVSMALSTIIPYVFLLTFYSQVCRPQGVAQMHFGWPQLGVSNLHKNLKYLLIGFIPVTFLSLVAIDSDLRNHGGEIAIILECLSVGIFAYIFLMTITNTNSLLGYMVNGFNTARHRKAKAALTIVFIGYFTFLLILVLYGYGYTGKMLTRYLMISCCLLFSLVIIRETIVRWLLIMRRRILYQIAIEKRDAARLEREQNKLNEPNPNQEETMEIEEPEVNLDSLDNNGKRLLNSILLISGVVALWFIWLPALPALEVFDEIVVWDRINEINGVKVEQSVTLIELILSIIILLFTYHAARGAPAILEFMLLQNSEIDSGTRYTSKTLLRYFIYAVGGSTSLSIIGFSWSQIQWLVAALGVGIGFGLQEIIANFICGLIILFERPIRIGDVVTVGDTDGVVTRIAMRATTITNWDRKELLVPNKEFVTSRLLNWSLSDPVTRVKILVGISYDADVQLALRLLAQIAQDHECVLEDPAPIISFDSFEDSSLLLQLKAYLPSIETRTSTITDIHKQILLQFNQHGITIPFPQADIHLDVAGPITLPVST